MGISILIVDDDKLLVEKLEETRIKQSSTSAKVSLLSFFRYFPFCFK